jgi:putative nucleotidyltransferase with HDIG domain
MENNILTTENKQSIDEIISLYERFGADDYIGEPVSQIEHMCQCAQLAENNGFDEEVILAAFFHDIGHLCEHLMQVSYMESFGVEEHEKLGAVYLREKGFSEKIAKLVASHVPAKRYLTNRFPDYFESLSNASKETLKLQGGIMSEEEALAFEQDPLVDLYIQLRRWDEQAKLEHIPLPSLTHYRKMMEHHLSQQ